MRNSWSMPTRHGSWLARGLLLWATSSCSRQSSGPVPADAQATTPAPAKSGSAGATPPAPSLRPSQPGTATVRGSVFHGGAPLAGVEVHLCHRFLRAAQACEGDHITAMTDAAGSYSFTNLTPGTHPAAVALAFDTPHVVWDQDRDSDPRSKPPPATRPRSSGPLIRGPRTTTSGSSTSPAWVTSRSAEKSPKRRSRVPAPQAGARSCGASRHSTRSAAPWRGTRDPTTRDGASSSVDELVRTGEPGEASSIERRTWCCTPTMVTRAGSSRAPRWLARCPRRLTPNEA